MNFSHDPQRLHVSKCLDVIKRPLQRRPVVEHQQHTGDCFHQKQEERDSSHTPRVRQSDALLLDGNRVQVQEEVRQHHHDTVTTVGGCRVTEDAFPDL
ncbi:MAG UNVERIFIED_CONTAM: hypothetical protein LVR18_42655 [Planctomycetaceae bacterium]